MNSAPTLVSLVRKSGIFTSHSTLVEKLEDERASIHLAPEQLLHPEPGHEYLVRLGRLRVSEWLQDGREITRAVLQAGGYLALHPSPEIGDKPAEDLYKLPDLVLMALGETELWQLPSGSLHTEI